MASRTSATGFGVSLQPLDPPPRPTVIEINGRRFKVKIWKDGESVDPSVDPRHLGAISRSYSRVFQNMTPEAQARLMNARTTDSVVLRHNANHQVQSLRSVSNGHQDGDVIDAVDLFQRQADASEGTLQAIGKALRGDSYTPDVRPSSAPVAPLAGLDQGDSEGLSAHQVAINALRAITRDPDSAVEVLGALRNGDATQQRALDAIFGVRYELERDSDEPVNYYELATHPATPILLADKIQLQNEEGFQDGGEALPLDQQARQYIQHLQRDARHGYGGVEDDSLEDLDHLQDAADSLGKRIFLERQDGEIEVFSSDDDQSAPNASDIFLLEDASGEVYQLNPPLRASHRDDVSFGPPSRGLPTVREHEEDDGDASPSHGGSTASSARARVEEFDPADDEDEPQVRVTRHAPPPSTASLASEPQPVFGDDVFSAADLVDEPPHTPPSSLSAHDQALGRAGRDAFVQFMGPPSAHRAPAHDEDDAPVARTFVPTAHSHPSASSGGTRVLHDHHDEAFDVEDGDDGLGTGDEDGDGESVASTPPASTTAAHRSPSPDPLAEMHRWLDEVDQHTAETEQYLEESRERDQEIDRLHEEVARGTAQLRERRAQHSAPSSHAPSTPAHRPAVSRSSATAHSHTGSATSPLTGGRLTREQMRDSLRAQMADYRPSSDAVDEHGYGSGDETEPEDE